MNRVLQNQFGSRGNCFSACLASLLEIPLEEVPNFYEVANSDEPLPWWQEVRKWLAKYNYTIVSISATEDTVRSVPGCYLIVGGLSVRGRMHATIWMNGEMVHDPHPSSAGLKNIECIDLLIPLDPAKFKVVE